MRRASSSPAAAAPISPRRLRHRRLDEQSKASAMTRLIGTLLALLWSAAAMAADGLDWAYPVTPPPEPLNSVIQKQVPGSTKKYTQAQIDDPFNPPDWFPNEHPPMPDIVARGGPKPASRACAQCHLPSGDGH